jgi:hypothetical protein
MHANALALMRQCVEAMSVIELGICGHPGAEAVLLKWDSDQLSSGKLRAWLQAHVWPRYGTGLWAEPWSIFMHEFSAAVQPYAHYSRNLAQWQLLFHSLPEAPNMTEAMEAIIEIRPRAYDAQKATRITLFHAILVYTLGRIWMAAKGIDVEFAALMDRFRSALGNSKYLDGHRTDWSQQFWAAVWSRDGDTVLE